MATRRAFVKKTALGAAALTLPIIPSLGKSPFQNDLFMNQPKISLAQWSLNKAFFSGELDARDFASIAKNSYGITAIEYVNQFYEEEAKNEKFWLEMARLASDNGVESLIMMVDEKEKLGDSSAAKRKKAVEDHYKWVNAAKLLGCHSVRVNAFGDGEPEALKSALVDGLGSLTEYAAKENIHVLLENHGLHTSNAAYMVDIIKAVNNPFLGTLPDFGNWCTSAEWGGTKESQNCTNIYDPAKGLTEWLPYAKGVSAKSYEFNEDGNDTVIDYPKLLGIVKNTGFDGYIGIEYEGEGLSASEGIVATKALIERTWAALD
ncbi:TIM barrel protein [Aggregatimonas sangjinii]|uniref:TIM barrel protein n=1 Tax=Aggregatimonas sangjinii TaxID=2583587 RepID=A0A5B7SPF9_9FLAO|nr:sugar phosphate isomerase/epimerase family protein [Aggregatimonas sangjinii]QCX00456.1 TIM barrel protein [Aggregatimonas sangjinii]